MEAQACLLDVWEPVRFILVCDSNWIHKQSDLDWQCERSHCVLQLFRYDLCVPCLSFVFRNISLVSMAMTLHWWVYAKNNNNNWFAIQCSLRAGILRLLRQWQKRRRLVCVALFCAVVFADFKTCLHYICNFLLIQHCSSGNNTTLFLRRLSACFL